MSYDERVRGFFQIFIQFDHYDGDGTAVVMGERVPLLSRLGLGMMAHEDGVNCTAQHVPDGSLIVYRPKSSTAPALGSTRISTIDFAPSVLRKFGVSQAAYMRGSPRVEL